MNFSAPGFSLTNDYDELSNAYRAERISDLARLGGHDLSSMQAMQHDYQSYTHRDLLPTLRALTTFQGTPALSLSAAHWALTLVDWDGVAEVGSKSATVFNRWLQSLYTLAAAETGQEQWTNLEYLLQALSSTTPDSNCLRGQSSCLAFAAACLNNVTALPDPVPGWGQGVHTATFAHQLLASTPLACVVDRSVAHGGDEHTVNVGGYSGSFAADGTQPMTQVPLSPSCPRDRYMIVAWWCL